MWEKLKTMTQHPAVQKLYKLCGDPVQLYAVFLIMTSMYYYHDSWAWLYTLLAIGVSFVLMRFYDFVAKRRLIGPVCYLVFLFVGLYGVNMITELGRKSYPISFAVWFLTPQSVVDFSMIYTIAIYLLMTGFLTSAVYYFAKVRYRMTMQFLIMLIPLSLYGKEGIQMPGLLVILMLASYFLLMVYCRQLRESPEIKHIRNFHSGVSVAVYVAAFSILAAIIPKPAVKTDREFIENAMAYSSWSDILMSAISMFTETTDNRAPTNNSSVTLYYVNAPSSLRLATQTYTYYSENDSWTVVEEYDSPNREPSDPLTYKPQELLQAILDIAAERPGFAETYGLTDVAGKILPEQPEYELYISPRYTGFSVLPAPTRTYDVEKAKYINLTVSRTDKFRVNVGIRNFVMHYYPDSYVRYEDVYDILRRFDWDTYDSLVSDAQYIARVSGDEEKEALFDTVFSECFETIMFRGKANDMDYHSAAVDALAKELTEGLTSDIDKALAIEHYFVREGYVYDDSYEKADGENVDVFLNETHRGVCYEYATAMVLLCRSAGLPARYAQGYNLSELYDSNTTSYNNPNGRDTNYVIKARNAHAFPEVYISGYGWVSFEPTVPSDDVEEAAAENLKIMQLGYVMLGLAAVIFLLWLLMPSIRERIFRKKIAGMDARQCASAIFVRMRQQLRLADSTTVSELAAQSAPFFKEEVLFEQIDSLLYQPEQDPAQQKGSLAEDYIEWQTNRKQYEKDQREKRKKKK